MPKIYSNQQNVERFREPVFSIRRTKFRGSRSSESENLETNLIKIDLSRILKELETIDTSIEDDLIYLLGDINDITTEVLADDGLSYQISGVQFYYDDTSTLENLEIDTTQKISGRLSRLLSKVQRLESGT
jgi:hypothetical protein